jgi:hypothetical protein
MVPTTLIPGAEEGAALISSEDSFTYALSALAVTPA